MSNVLLYPIALIYSIFVRIRNILYDHKIIRSNYFHNTFVITIGNLAVGGTGKTPMTEFLVNLLKDKYSVAVLSRGYKRKSKGFKYVTPEMNVDEAGDEPLQIALKFPQIVVAVCADRTYAIKKITSEKKANVIILDDAFQHRKVKPHLSILLTEYNRPFFNDKFLPVGRLRDNKFEAERADIIIVTKSPDTLKPIEKNIWRDNLKLRPYQSLFFSAISYLSIKNVFDRTISISKEELRNKDIILVTGIANSQYLYDYLKKFSNKIIHLKFSDHKNYSSDDVKRIVEAYENIENSEKLLITTEKDAVKLRKFELNKKIKENFYYQEVGVEILLNQEDRLVRLLGKKIKA